MLLKVVMELKNINIKIKEENGNIKMKLYVITIKQKEGLI